MAERLLPTTVALALACCGHAAADARDDDWWLRPRAEFSSVRVAGVAGSWRQSGLDLERHFASGHRLFAGYLRQSRGALDDDAVRVGGTLARGAWQFHGAVQASGSPTFLPRHALDLGAERRVAPGLRAGLGYRRLDFRAGAIGIWSPQLTWNRGDDEYGVTYLNGSNPGPDHAIRIVQLRAVKFWDATQFGAYLAHGDYIFDALGIPDGDGRGWSATLTMARRIHRRLDLRVELSAGAETGGFRQHAIGLALGYSP